jgi:nucleoside-diphosphate-sugar epimerase
MGRRIVITGSSGFLGRALVASARRRGFYTVGLDLRPSSDKGPDEFHLGDVRNPALVAAALAKADLVVHAAAAVPLAHAPDMLDINAVGTRVVASVTPPSAPLIHISSSAVYGLPTSLPVRVDSSLDPCEPYGRSKLAAERALLEVRGSLPWVIFRPRTIVDPSRGGLFSLLRDLIECDAAVPVFGATTTIQLLHVNDCVDAVFAAAADRSCVHQTFNLGALDPHPLVSHMEECIRLAGSSSKVLVLPAAPAMAVASLAVRLKLIPFAPWHTKTYGVSNVVDLGELPPSLLPKVSNAAVFASLMTAVPHRTAESGESPHVAPLAVSPLRTALRLVGRVW